MMAKSQRPFARRVQASLMRIVNVPMRVILGLPVSTPLGKRLMLAFIVGRKTGKTYRQPVSYVSDGDTLLTPGGGRWKRNLVGNPSVRLRIRGRDLVARAELVDNLEVVSRLLSLILVSNPSADSFVRVKKNPDGSLDTEDLRNAIKYGFSIVRWHLNEVRSPAQSSED
jgi:deazaflavin-dependent oxidoreductase (nitroreductase family)